MFIHSNLLIIFVYLVNEFIHLVDTLHLWRLEHYDEHLFEFERCAKKWSSSRIKQPCPNHIVQVFSRLMLRGQVRSAVRCLTERINDGGVLDPSQLVNDGSKRVLDFLREKHPDPAILVRKLFCHAITFLHLLTLM